MTDLQITDGRGKHLSEIGKENKKRVKEFFEAHPGATKAECARALDLTHTSICRHVKAIQSQEA